jgi:hypothetical protein
VSWEQILTKCKDKPSLWIITRDSDYATKHEGKMFLNALLYQELALGYQKQPEVFCFDNIAEGLKHFSETTSVIAKKLPTPDETEQIKKEQESLPPLGWLVNSGDALSTAIRDADMHRVFMTAALAGQLNPTETYNSQFANAIAGLNLKEALAASQFANTIAGLNLKETLAASQFANTIAGLNIKQTLATSEFANAIAGLNPPKALATSPITDASVGKPASEKQNPLPDETKAKNDGG